MATKDEALKMAIETLEECLDDLQGWAAYASDYFQGKWDLEGEVKAYKEKINSLKEALEQPTTEKSSEAEPAQEPVMISDCNAARQIWENNLKESEKILSKCKFAKSDDKQPAQEPVACPYPCGWNNLYSIIVKKGAYLAQSTIGEDEIFTSHQRNEMVQIIDYAKTLCQWGKNTHPAPSSYQSNGKLSYSEELAYQTGFEAGREFERSCDD